MSIYRFNAIRILLACCLAVMTPQLRADADGLYELSGRFNIVGASGKPTNDILGFGVILHRKLSDQWYLGIGFDNSTDFDVETPNDEVDIISVSETDALATMNMITVVAERRYALESENWTGFWNLGGGVADIDVDNADGGVKDGGRFDIKIDVETEYVLIGSVGAMQRLGQHWSARYEATLEQHFADWDIEDQVSGRTGSFDDYTVFGLRIGMNYRF
jgi:hypothetical protein